MKKTTKFIALCVLMCLITGCSVNTEHIDNKQQTYSVSENERINSTDSVVTESHSFENYDFENNYGCKTLLGINGYYDNAGFECVYTSEEYYILTFGDDYVKVVEFDNSGVYYDTTNEIAGKLEDVKSCNIIDGHTLIITNGYATGGRVCVNDKKMVNGVPVLCTEPAGFSQSYEYYGWWVPVECIDFSREPEPFEETDEDGYTQTFYKYYLKQEYMKTEN